MAVNDSEKKAEAISEKRVEKGEELQQFQEAQGELFNIQAEQRNNLNEQRAVSGMEVQNNQTLAQAAEILAASGGVAGGAAMVSPHLNRGTQGILKKYGIKPGSVTKTQTNTQQSQSPQRINVTNNTTTNTTNNIQMAAPQIPMAAPVIPMRAGAGGGDTERFKVWVSNAFAKQNEAAAIREKEYRKREWSLTRSANKMIRKMGEIGKNIGDTMNPKRLVGTMNNQFKVLMFLMGFQFLSKNIKGILEGVDRFVYWITDGNYPNGGKLGKSNEWRKISETFKNIIGSDFFKGLSNVFDAGITRLTDELKLIFEDRGRAIKSIEFPNIKLTDDLMTTIGKIGTYLGDIISTALTGTEGLVKRNVREFKSSGRSRSMETYNDSYSHTQDIEMGVNVGHTSRNGISMSNVSIGDIVTSAEGFKNNFKMASRDYNSFGGLANNIGASVKQSSYAMNLIDRSFESGKAVDISQLTSALSSIHDSAKRYGGTLVSIEFMQKLGICFRLPKQVYLRIIQKMKTAKVRYIIIPKSEAELSDENASSFSHAFGKTLIEHQAIKRIAGGGIFGNIVATSREKYKDLKKGNIIEGAFTGSGPISAIDGGITNAITSGITSATRQLTSDKYTIKMVEVGDPRYEKYETLYTKDGKVYVDQFGNNYLVLTPAIIRDFEAAIKAQHGLDIKLEAENTETIKNLDKLFNTNLDGSTITDGNGIGDFNKTLEIVTELENQRKAAREDLDIKHSQDAIGKLTSSSESSSTSSNNSISTSSINSIDSAEAYDKAYTFTKEDLKNNSNYIMGRLLNDPDLGLTKEQAAGLVGNLIEESGLIQGRHNGDDRGEPASGIAQWRGDRREKYKEIYGKYPNEDKDLGHEVDYLISELKNSEKKSLRLVKEKSNLVDTTYSWMVNFERPHDQTLNGENHKRRFRHALGVLKTYNETLGNKNYKYNYTIPEIIEEKPNTNTNTNTKPNTLQEKLALQYTPTANKKDIKEIDINSKDSINPLADAMTIYGDIDTFAANQLEGKEKAWYEMYNGKSRDELERIFNEEGIVNPKSITLQAAKIGGNLSDKRDLDNNFINSPLSVVWEVDRKEDRKKAQEEINNIIRREGLSGLYTKYLKEGFYLKDPNKFNIDYIGRVLLGDKYKNKNDLKKFVEEHLLDKNTPTLSSSIYYHTTKEQRDELAKLFIPGGLYKGTKDEIDRWEDAYLGKVRIAEITEDRYNKGVKNARASWLETRISELTEERKEQYLKDYINANLGKGESIKDKEGKYNFNSISKISSNIYDSWLKNKGELSKPVDTLIREMLKGENGDIPTGVLSEQQIQEGFFKLSEKLKTGTYDERFKISKDLVAANKLHEMSLGVDEFNNKTETETLDFLKKLVKDNKNTKEGREYLKERLGITDDLSFERLINGFKEDGTETAGVAEVLKSTKLYKQTKESVNNYYAGTLGEAKGLKEVTENFGDISQTAMSELKRLSSIQRVKIDDTNEFKLLNEMGKKITPNDLPNIELDQVGLAKEQNETLKSILRNLLINGYYEKVIAETNYDILGIDIANLKKGSTVNIISSSEDKEKPTIITSGT